MSIDTGTGGDGVPTTRIHESAGGVDHSPPHGFALVKVAYGRPPAEAQTLVARFDCVDDVVIPAGTPDVGYVLYDAAGNTYTRDEFGRAAPAEPTVPTGPASRWDEPRSS